MVGDRSYFSQVIWPFVLISPDHRIWRCFVHRKKVFERCICESEKKLSVLRENCFFQHSVAVFCWENRSKKLDTINIDDTIKFGWWKPALHWTAMECTLTLEVRQKSFYHLRCSQRMYWHNVLFTSWLT